MSKIISTLLSNKLNITGIDNYIANHRKFTTDSSLSLSISTGVEVINEKVINRGTNSITLYASRAQLIYDTTYATTGIITAAFPAADAGTINRWIIEGYTSAISTVGTNNLIRNGTVNQVVGWASDYGSEGDGSSGYYNSSNVNGFPTGANAREIDIVFTRKSAVNELLVMYSAANGSGGFGLTCESTGELKVYFGSSQSGGATGYICDIGKTYYVALVYNGTTITVYVNGRLIWSYVTTLNTVAVSLTVGRWTFSAAYYYTSTIYYVEVRNALRTAEQISIISNALLLPNRRYTDYVLNTYTDIRGLLPANSISLGFVRTDTTHPTFSNSSDYKYGRRETIMSGNRCIFLGWMPFNGTTIVTWENPFDTRMVKTTFFYSEDVNGKNAAPIVFSESGTAWPTASPASPIQLEISATGACYYGGGFKTSGYVGCYAEVIE